MPRWPGTPEERAAATLRSRSVNDGECVRFTGAHDKLGYGRIAFRGVNRLVHTVAWELVNGPVPDGYELDHVYRNGCRHRDCIRLDHLEAVIHAENVRRTRQHHKVGMCEKGLHEQTGPGKCLECKRNRSYEYHKVWQDDNREKCRKYWRDHARRKREAERRVTEGVSQ